MDKNLIYIIIYMLLLIAVVEEPFWARDSEYSGEKISFPIYSATHSKVLTLTHVYVDEYNTVRELR